MSDTYHKKLFKDKNIRDSKLQKKKSFHSYSKQKSSFWIQALTAIEEKIRASGR